MTAMALAFASVLLALPPGRHLVSDRPLPTSALFTDPAASKSPARTANITRANAPATNVVSLVGPTRTDVSEEEAVRLQEEQMATLEKQMSEIQKDAGQVVGSAALASLARPGPWQTPPRGACLGPKSAQSPS